jgi:transmembrane sensor
MLRRKAVKLLAARQSGRDPNIESKIRKWCEADPRHAAAFDSVLRSYERAGLLRHSPLAVAARPRPALGKPEWKPRPAFAAAAAIVVLVPAGTLLLRGGSPFAGTNVVMLMTSVGEIKQVNLADGSRITLDTATKVEVEIGRSRRTAHLKYGRARFAVAQSSAPFVVETANSTVSTRQGVVDVEQIGSQSGVQVLAGIANVHGADLPASSNVALGAGQSVAINADGGEPRRALAAAPDWTRGMLQLDGTPLAEAVALANRYSGRHIILVGDLEELRVTGAFRAGDTVGLAKALAAAFGLSIQQRADGNLILARKGSSASRK